MSVYVGTCFNTTGLSRTWPYSLAAHLYADTDAELLAFATRIGLKPEWAQKLGTHKAHFDVTAPKRRAALAAGARPHTPHDEGVWLRARRKQRAEAAEGTGK